MERPTGGLTVPLPGKKILQAKVQFVNPYRTRVDELHFGLCYLVAGIATLFP